MTAERTEAERLNEIRATSTYRERELFAEIARLQQERDALRAKWQQACETNVEHTMTIATVTRERDAATREAEALRALLIRALTREHRPSGEVQREYQRSIVNVDRPPPTYKPIKL